MPDPRRAIRISAEHYARTGCRSDFCYHRCFPTVIAVIDCQMGGMSVTNDAEAVVSFLRRRAGLRDGDWVVYRDTDGVWDVLAHQSGMFTGFRAVRTKTLKDALQALGVPT